jgi:hypothetical protein
MEKDLLPAAGKESTSVIPKVVSSWNKGSIGILLRKPIHIHRERYYGDGCIPNHVQIKMYFIEHAPSRLQFKKEKWQTHSWACLAPGHAAHV